MVHAEASNFAVGIGKGEAYKQVIEQAEALFEGQRNWVLLTCAIGMVGNLQVPFQVTSRSELVNLANAASLLYHAYRSLPEPSGAVNWAGFYTLDHANPSQLILGPFQGKVACQTIAFGKGVCGVAAQRAEPVVVPDVEKFPGHIACDADSQSEIVVPIVKSGKVMAIIDIDCAQKNGFGDEDRENLVRLSNILAEACDW